MNNRKYEDMEIWKTLSSINLSPTSYFFVFVWYKKINDRHTVVFSYIIIFR